MLRILLWVSLTPLRPRVSPLSARVEIRASSDDPTEEVVFQTTGIRGSDILPEDNLQSLKEGTALTLAVCFVAYIATNQVFGAAASLPFAAAPVIFVAVGSVAPQLTSALIDRDRFFRHEAAHVVAGRLCGLRVLEFDVGLSPRVEFDDDGRRDRDAVETLAAVALSGAVSECLTFGKAKGVDADLRLLQRLLDAARPPYTAREQQAATRRAVINAHRILTDNEDLVSRVEAAMRRPNADLTSLLAEFGEEALQNPT